ncbi:UNVERIFIED_CONTAM: putative HTH domain antitoxin [Acetivibrio alkalicellulosi]
MLTDNANGLNIPDEFIQIIDKTGYGKSLNEKFRLSLAIGLFVDKSVTLEKAAELAGKPLANFIDILVSRKIPWMEYTDQHVEEDDFAIMKYSEEKGHNE